VGGFGVRAPQALGHVVEGVHQEPHLVARGQRQARPEVALADRARALDEVLHRTHQALRGVDRAVDGRQHGEQQHQREREPEAGLQGLAQGGQVAVLVVGALHRFRQRGELRRHGVDRHHEARVMAGGGVAQRRGGADEVVPAGARLETDVRPALLHLSHQIRRGLRGHAFQGTLEARGEDALVGTEQRDFGGLAGTPFRIES
jgi:hypothetical protein